MGGPRSCRVLHRYVRVAGDTARRGESGVESVAGVGHIVDPSNFGGTVCRSEGVELRRIQPHRCAACPRVRRTRHARRASRPVRTSCGTDSHWTPFGRSERRPVGVFVPTSSKRSGGSAFAPKSTLNDNLFSVSAGGSHRANPEQAGRVPGMIARMSGGQIVVLIVSIVVPARRHPRRAPLFLRLAMRAATARLPRRWRTSCRSVAPRARTTRAAPRRPRRCWATGSLCSLLGGRCSEGRWRGSSTSHSPTSPRPKR